MKTLILGQGGREHAIAWKVAQSAHVDEIFVAPGNAGTMSIGKNIAIDVTDIEQVMNVITEHTIDIVIIGPEAPLAEGIADLIREQRPHTIVVGPGHAGARLEASKGFAKSFMQDNDIPTAKYMLVDKDNRDTGQDYLRGMSTPIVLKADGLAAGKGVLICQSHEEASTALTQMLDGKFGAASSTVVIEEFLSGREYSMFVLTNGHDYYLLPSAKDYKRIGEGDTGLNTGGMGAVSPVSYLTPELLQKTIDQVIHPTLAGLSKADIDYQGFIFFGMIEVAGNPYVIEYNCRMGDPETEVVMPRIESDLIEHIMALHDGNIDDFPIRLNDDACTTVMLVSGGYPEGYQKGKTITGLADLENVIPFHAGTRMDDDQIVTNGGRVIALTALAPTTREALKKSYAAAQSVHFDQQYYRTDIGFDI